MPSRADNLLDGLGLDARQPAHALEQMPVRARIIHRPVAGERAAVAHRQIGIGITVDIGIAQARARPFGFLLLVGRQREIVVFDGGPFLEGLLRKQHAADTQSKDPKRTIKR